MSVKRVSTQGGFTFPEMMVVIFIMIVLSTISAFKYSDFRDAAQLKTIAQDAALAIKEAQTYGVAVYESASGFEHAYGVHFQVGVPKYTLFVDSISDNHWLDDSAEEIRTNWFDSNYTLSSICTGPIGGELCGGLTQVSITFKRPDLAADVRTSFADPTPEPEGVHLHFQSPDSTRELVVHVTVTGQIYVE